MSEQETVKDVIKRIVKSINTIKTEVHDTSLKASARYPNGIYDIRKVSPEPPACNGCTDGVSINPNCDICRYRVLLKARHMTAYDTSLEASAKYPNGIYDSVFPLKVSTLN